ncbi:MAG: hypothetical protein QOE08_1594, partial [Thermoleophilaceae bacterium]|nr:hypothetical protein [Thermoleophilaceae bacterium]
MELRAKHPAARLATAVALVAVVLLAMAGAARAQELKLPEWQTKPPGGYVLTARKAIAIADRDGKVRAERRKGTLLATAYTKAGVSQWQVSYFRAGKEKAQVTIDDHSGTVLESWTGPQVAWRMARGYSGAFAGRVNAPYVWLPFCVLFLAPFVNIRRPLRLLHVDLLVLLAFGVSQIFFNRGEISTSVPLVYPVLAYLLVRLLAAGLRPRERRERLVPHVPLVWLACALVFLAGFRIALNVADSSVIDVGYASVIGADRIADRHGLYDGGFPSNNEHGDTYGPVSYLTYVPFEQAFPWSGQWDDLPAAHGAAIAFDLLTMAGLFLLGRRLRAGPPGTALGVALAYGWAAFPYTLFALNSNSNDTLISMLLVFALLALTSAPVRGAMIALAAAAKFAPLALAPLFATAGPSRHRVRDAVLFSLTLAVVVAACFLPFIPHGGLREIYDRTFGYQAGRDSPFSIWGQYHSLGTLWTVAKAATVALALAVAFVPRRKTPVQVAALGAAVLIALQIVVSHWFYLYIVWFAPFVLVALFAPYRGDAEPERDAESAEIAAGP